MGAGAGPPGCAWVQGEGSRSSIRKDGVGDKGNHLMNKPQLTRQWHLLQPLHTIPSHLSFLPHQPPAGFPLLSHVPAVPGMGWGNCSANPSPSSTSGPKARTRPLVVAHVPVLVRGHRPPDGPIAPAQQLPSSPHPAVQTLTIDFPPLRGGKPGTTLCP